MFNIGTKEIINELENFKFEKIDSYEVIELINEPSQEVIDLAEKIKEKTEKDLNNCSEQQLKFYNDCSKLIFGELKDSSPVLIPAKCGFGKTTFLKSMINTVINEIKNNKLSEEFLPMIIVQERLEDLKDLCKDINKLGKYHNKNPYIFLLEGWNDKLACINDFPPESIKESYAKCNSVNCNVFKKCKLKTQYVNATKSPILAITTARLSHITNNNELNKYTKFKNGDGTEALRNKLIIDEKPKFIRNEVINSKLTRELKGFVEEYNNKTPKRKNFEIEMENYFLEELNTIENYLNKQREEYKDFENLIINFDKSVIKQEFVDKWREHIKKKNPDFDLLLEIFNEPLLWSKRGNSSNYHLIAHNNFNTEDIDTFIFDGTAEITLEYKSEYNNFKYLKINDYKDYSHLTFHIIRENFSKHSLKNEKKKKDEKSKMELACEWINFNFKEKTYVVSYSDYKKELAEKFEKNKYVIQMKVKGKKMFPYFGNTKGRNEWAECKKMVQIGWYRYDNATYISQFLSLNPDFLKYIKELYERYLINDEHKEKLFDLLDSITPSKNGQFSNIELQKYMLRKMIIDLEQEVYRTHVREFTSSEEVDIYLFVKDEDYQEYHDMLSNRFINCNFKEDIDFKEYKIFNKNDDLKKLFEELDNEWDGNTKEVAILKKKYNMEDKWHRYFSKDSDLKKNMKFLLDKRSIYCYKTQQNKIFIQKGEVTDPNIIYY